MLQRMLSGRPDGRTVRTVACQARVHWQHCSCAAADRSFFCCPGWLQRAYAFVCERICNWRQVLRQTSPYQRNSRHRPLVTWWRCESAQLQQPGITVQWPGHHSPRRVNCCRSLLTASRTTRHDLATAGDSVKVKEDTTHSTDDNRDRSDHSRCAVEEDALHLSTRYRQVYRHRTTCLDVHESGISPPRHAENIFYFDHMGIMVYIYECISWQIAPPLILAWISHWLTRSRCSTVAASEQDNCGGVV